MFQIKQNPTIDVALTITGQGREQTLNLTFKAKTRSEYSTLLGSIDYEKPESAIDLVLALVEKWDADLPLNRESVQLLADHQPGAEWAIVHAYTEALPVARKGN
jgi:hypothetical protein